MSVFSRTLIIYNIAHRLYNHPRLLSIAGDENTNYQVPPNSSISLDLHKVQFNESYIDTLTSYIDAGVALVTLDGTELTSDQVGALKYGGSVDEEEVAVSYTTSFSVTGASLIDGQNITIAESTLATTSGIASTVTIDPSVSSGQVTIEIFQDSGKTQKISEHVIDLSDSTTYIGHNSFGFTNGTTGTLYATLSCSGVAGGATADFTISAHALTPSTAAASITSSLGSGLETGGGGLPQIALASNSGLTLSGDELAIEGDNTQPAYLLTNANGAYVTGAVDTTTAQTVAGEKRFSSAGLVPTAASGAPVAGTWSIGTEIIDANKIKYRCTTAGTPGTWELADIVTENPDVVISSAVAVGGDELLKIPVKGNVGTALWLRVWARRSTGTAEMQIPFRARIYETTAKNGRDLVWQGLGSARQTYLTVELPASQTYLEVNDNNVVDVDELVCVYDSDSRYEIGRCSSRSSGYISVDEALVDASSWAINSLVLISSEWTMVPWVNSDGDSSDQENILLEVRHDGIAGDPSLVFYAQVKAMSLGVIR